MRVGEPSGVVRWLVLAGEVSPYVPELWRAVAEQPGQEVALLLRVRTNRESFEHEDGGRGEWAPLKHYPTEGGVSAATAMFASVRERPDIVVCLGHAAPMNVAGAALARSLFRETRVVYMGDTNGVDLASRTARLRGALALQAKRAVLRQVFREAFELGWTNTIAATLYGIRHHHPIPLYAVDFEALDTAVPYAGWESHERPVFLCPARLVAEKNHEGLFNAWALYKLQGGRGALIIAGDGPLRRHLEARAQSLPGVTLVGSVPRSRIGAALMMSDAVVLPSIFEPWGIAVVEGLGMGLPVLASRSVGSAVSLAGCALGAVRLTDAGAEQIANALRDFECQLERHTAAARECKPRVRELFDTKSVAASLAAWGRHSKTPATAEPAAP